MDGSGIRHGEPKSRQEPGGPVPPSPGSVSGLLLLGPATQSFVRPGPVPQEPSIRRRSQKDQRPVRKACARCSPRARRRGRGSEDEAGKGHAGEAGVETRGRAPEEGNSGVKARRRASSAGDLTSAAPAGFSRGPSRHPRQDSCGDLRESRRPHPSAHGRSQSVFPESSSCDPPPAAGTLQPLPRPSIFFPRALAPLLSAHLSPQHQPPATLVKTNPCLALPSPSPAPARRFCSFILWVVFCFVFFCQSTSPFLRFSVTDLC